jgi:hypothetical protein
VIVRSESGGFVGVAPCRLLDPTISRTPLGTCLRSLRRHPLGRSVRQSRRVGCAVRTSTVCRNRTTQGHPVWLNRDPIFEDGGFNLYQFASNDPANAFDPFGLDEHHYVTGPIRYDPNVSPDAQKVFRDCTTGDVGKHDYSKPHPSYNEAVQEQWDDWITGKDKGKLTAGQAREFVDKVKSSTDPRIKPFLDDLHNRALKQARKKLAQKAVARIAKKAGPAVAAGCFIYDWNEGGFIHAVDEAVWPLSELW